MTTLKKVLDTHWLDSLRADIMRALLNEEGKREIWKYDITTPRYALSDALDRDNYDNVQGYFNHRDDKFVLMGRGIDDHYFSTPAQLLHLLLWLCQREGPLSCYAAQPLAEANNRAWAAVDQFNKDIGA